MSISNFQRRIGKSNFLLTSRLSAIFHNNMFFF